MRRAIVTGAGGFIGRHLVWELLDNGYDVLAVIHREESRCLLTRPGKPDPQFVRCDMAEIKDLPKLANGCYDYFFHMAWEGVSGPPTQSFEIQTKNVQYAVDAVCTAAEMGCKRFVGAGSLHEIECRKEMERPAAVTNKTNYYKTAKLSAHYCGKLKAAELGVDFFWPRLTNTYGAGEISNRLINSMIRKLLRGESPALTPGDQLYNFIYITDVARAYRLIAEKGISFADYVLGSEEVKPLREFLTQVGQVVAPDIPLGFGLHSYSGVYLDHGELYTKSFFRDTDFHTEVSFEEGIRRTTEFLRRVE